MEAQDHIQRLLVEEIGEVLYPGGGKAYANSGIPYIPCKWNGFHPDALLTPGTQTNNLPDFTWVGARYEQVGERMALVPAQSSAVYRKYDWGTRSVRCLIPDDPQGKNRKRLGLMVEYGKKNGHKPEYELLLAPSGNRAALESMDAATLDQLQAMLDKARAAQTAAPSVPEAPVPPAEAPADGF